MLFVIQVDAEVVGIFCSVFVLEISDRIQDFIGCFGDSESSAPLGSFGLLALGCSERVDLADGEPGESGEHKVEKVLTDMDHDVLVLKDSFLDNITNIEKKLNKISFDENF